MIKHVIVLILTGIFGGLAHAGAPTEEDLLACYGLEFQYDKITPEAAFTIGECFSELAQDIARFQYDHYSYYQPAPGELSNQAAVLHYAGSWYSKARYQGHPDADAQLQQTYVLLSE